MVCGSGALAASPPVRAVHASSQASRAAGASALRRGRMRRPGRLAECGEGTIARQFDERIHHLNKTAAAGTNDDGVQSPR